jgi:hypothetical protein
MGKSGMSELVKILVSAVIGFFSALLMEPLKYHFNIWLTSRRAETAINRELGRIYQLFCLREQDDEYIYWAAFMSNLPQVYEYYFKQHREAFYKIKWYERYEGFYAIYQVAKNGFATGRITAVKAADYINKERVRMPFRYRIAQP